MINFFSETTFDLSEPTSISNWIEKVIALEGCHLGEINYIFCDDSYLLELNMKYLNHETLTDIISFDSSLGKEISGDVFISIERVRDNANALQVTFHDELARVIIHGILHFCGYNDKSEEEEMQMRIKEDECLKILNN